MDTQHGDELAASLVKVDAAIEGAFDDTEMSGKAELPIAE